MPRIDGKKHSSEHSTCLMMPPTGWGDGARAAELAAIWTASAAAAATDRVLGASSASPMAKGCVSECEKLRVYSCQKN